MKKNKQTILDEFDKSMKRDKSKDIIVGNPFHKNDRFQKEMFNNMFYEKMRDFIGWDVITGEAHIFERALYTLFTSNFKIKSKYNN